MLAAFAQLSGRILSRTVLPWSEHCTECVWPTCYTTCDLYAPRQDGRCRRFHDGMVRIESPSAANSYLLKIRFKQWGKLWTPRQYSTSSRRKSAKARNAGITASAALLQASPLPSLVKIAVTKKRYGFKKRVADSAPVGEELPTCFLLECFNPLMQEVSLSLTMRATDQASNMPFQKLIHLTPGYHSVRVPLEEISRFIDLREPFGIELIPNQESDETTLYFGLMDFVTEAAESKANGKGSDQDSSGKSQNQKKIKCVVWDLDNTLWDGVLVEDGPDRLRLKPG